MSEVSEQGSERSRGRKRSKQSGASERVSGASERANERAQRRARAKRAVRSKRTSEWCERTSERTSEWPSTFVSILVCSRPQCMGEVTRGLLSGRCQWRHGRKYELSHSEPTIHDMVERNGPYHCHWRTDGLVSGDVTKRRGSFSKTHHY